MEVLLYVDPVEVIGSARGVVRDVGRGIKELLQVNRPVTGAAEVAKKKWLKVSGYSVGTGGDTEEGRCVLALVELFSVIFDVFAHPCNPFKVVVYHNVAVTVSVNPGVGIRALPDDLIDLSI